MDFQTAVQAALGGDKVSRAAWPAGQHIVASGGALDVVHPGGGRVRYAPQTADITTSDWIRAADVKDIRVDVGSLPWAAAQYNAGRAVRRASWPAGTKVAPGGPPVPTTGESYADILSSVDWETV